MSDRPGASGAGARGPGIRRSLVLLTFNEIEAAPKVYDTIPLGAAAEVFGVDGGSKDGTIDFLRSKGLRVVVQEERGRGVAFRLGCQEARGEFVVFYSLDGNEDPADVSRLFELLETQGADMVIASRMMAGAFNEEDVSWWRPRKWVNQAFTLGANLCFNRGPTITDTINGYRGVRKSSMERMRTDAKGFPIEFQMSIRAMKLGMKVVEFPTIEGARVGGVSTAESWSTGVVFVKLFLSELFAGRGAGE